MNQKVAVIGCGYWGKNLVRNFAQLDSLEWICDSNQTLLEKQSQIYPKVKLTNNIEQILQDKTTTAIVIATPAISHYSLAEKAILADKDIFVEKPLALTYTEGEKLVNLAKEKDKILMVGHILEYHPAITKLKEIIAQGELGNLLYIYSQRLNLGKVRQEENILWSFAPHDIAVISSLVGQEAIEVKASGGNYLQPNITDIAIINLNFANGIKSHIFVSWLNPYKEQKLVVIGDRQMAVFNDTLPEGKLKIYNQRIEWREGIPTPHKEGETIIPLPEAEPLKLECQHFLTCIKTRQKPLTDGENGLKVLKVLAACGGVGE